MISKFVEFLGPEVLNYCDSSGNTLFHYAVGCLDEDSIYKVNLIQNIKSKRKRFKINRSIHFHMILKNNSFNFD